jgi:hypothetical protein
MLMSLLHPWCHQRWACVFASVALACHPCCASIFARANTEIIFFVALASLPLLFWHCHAMPALLWYHCHCCASTVTIVCWHFCPPFASLLALIVLAYLMLVCWNHCPHPNGMSTIITFVFSKLSNWHLRCCCLGIIALVKLASAQSWCHLRNWHHRNRHHPYN